MMIRGSSMSHDDVTAPFTPEQVDLLTRFQTGGWFHPFTCGRRSEHRENEGILIATIEGWRCPVESCTYEQDWAHWFMADKEFVTAREKGHREAWAGFWESDDNDS